MEAATMLGLGAAFCTTLAFLPQALHAWRTRSTKDISLGMFALMVLGSRSGWLTGCSRPICPLIISNSITLLLAGSILILKLRHG